MQIFLTCLSAVLPIFAFMAVGYVCQRIGVIKREHVGPMNKVAFNVFLTCTVFISVYSCDLASTFDLGLMVFCACMTLGSFALAVAYSRFFVRVDNQRGVVVQGIFRSNFIMVGMQLASGLAGQEGMAAVAMLCVVTVPLNNVLAVVTLSLHGGQTAGWGQTLVEIAKNPLIIATLLGIALLVLGIQLPSPIVNVISQMSSASTPLMLFLLGAFFRFGSLGTYALQLAAVCIGRLIIVPSIVVALACACGFSGVAMVALVSIFAASTANASFTMAQQMGGDAELAGDIVAVTSVACPVTLFAWSFALMSMGLM